MSPEPPKEPSLLETLAGRAVFSEKPPDMDIGAALKALAGIRYPPPPPPLPPPTIKDRWFKDQTINLDGYTFERCRFDHCQLVTLLATFSFRNCYISPTCRVLFDGPALKVVRLFMHALALGERLPYDPNDAGVHPTHNDDGTITLA